MVVRFRDLPPAQYLYRSMAPDGDNPSIGPTNFQLEVRTNAGSYSDVTIREDGMVYPGDEGLSVTPDDPMFLPSYRRPLEWQGRSRHGHPVWCIRVDDLGPDLAFRKDPRNPESHGFIGSAYSMPFERFRDALHSTRDRWKIVIP